MQTADRALTILLVGSFSLTACIKKNSSQQSEIPSQDHFIEIYEEPKTLPLSELIKTLKEKARAKLPKNGLAVPVESTYAACGATVSIPGTQLCIFTVASGMNFALNRASHWIEEKEMLDHADLQYTNYRLKVQGHNLAGRDLKEFTKAYEAKKEDFDKAVPPIAKPKWFDELGNGLGLEREFWSTYLQNKVNSVPNLYLLAVTTDAVEALDHEVLHALYYNSADMQKIVTEFWLKEMSLGERKDTINELSSTGAYAVENDDPEAPSFLLLNEFQAYVLMDRSGFDVDKFASLSSKYKDRLSKKLQEKGIQLPQTHVK